MQNIEFLANVFADMFTTDDERYEIISAIRNIRIDAQKNILAGERIVDMFEKISEKRIGSGKDERT